MIDCSAESGLGLALSDQPVHAQPALPTALQALARGGRIGPTPAAWRRWIFYSCCSSFLPRTPCTLNFAAAHPPSRLLALSLYLPFHQSSV